MSNLGEQLDPPVPEEEIAAAAEQPAAEKPEVDAEKPKQEAKAEEEKKQTMVPHAALHEERQKRKEIERKLAQAEETRKAEFARLEGRLQQVYQATQPQPQGPQYRDPQSDPDPLAAMQHNERLNAQRLYEIQARQAQEEQRRIAQYQQQVAVRDLVGWAASQAQEFSKENPDFQDAYSHIRKVRTAELQLMGYEGEELINQLHNEELNVFASARQKGRNPAEIAFEMAKAVGWQPKKLEPTAEDKMTALQKGAEASKALGNGGGSTGMPTAEQIGAMSDSEFADFKAKLSKKGIRLSDVL